jgi:thiopeptide-type bacteriocin biosynthesis protein
LYQHHDALIVRASAFPAHLAVTPWPDLTERRDGQEQWRDWLSRALSVPGFAEAVEQASPVLARRTEQIVDGRDIPADAARRAMLSVMRYMLRAASRATPFGLFAGIAPARIGSAALRVGSAHRAVMQADAPWVMAAVRRLEAEPTLLPLLTVASSNIAVERDGYLILDHRAGEADVDIPGSVRVRITPPVAAAISFASSRLAFSELKGKLAAEFPRTSGQVIERMLTGLVRERFLITSLRPPMTETDPLEWLAQTLETVGDGQIGWPTRFPAMSGEATGPVPTSHDRSPTRADRARLSARMASLYADLAPRPTADLLLDWDLTLPDAVASEVARVASALARLAPRPCPSAGWASWHVMFLERYGPRAVVPVLDAINSCTGVGYPPGYQGSLPVAAQALTDRDRNLLALAQSAALRRAREITLDDAMLARLQVTAEDTPVQPTSEVTVRVSAPTLEHLARAEFTLAVTGVSRAAGTTTGRFLSMLPAADRNRIAACYAQMPTGTDGALRVQISAPPRYTRAGSVARAPQVMTHVIRLGENNAVSAVGQVAVEDIAVTADNTRIWLVWLPAGKVIEPVALNAVEPVNFAHPLARFLTEAPHALSAPCCPFDWGTAATLPFLPALRYGRTLISAALWRLDAAAVPGRDADWREWDAALTTWREAVNLPDAVFAGAGDRRIRLDLAESAHRAQLRDQLDRTGSLILRDAPGMQDAGWASGHAHEITVPVSMTTRSAAPPWWLPTTTVASGNDVHLPCRDGRLYVKVYASTDAQDDILVRHLPRLAGELGDDVEWWFLRYHDPAPHIRLRAVVPDNALSRAAQVVGDWCEEVRCARLATRVQWDTYFPETARFGGPSAMPSAERFFAADSAAVLAQLAACASHGGPDATALTAASMLDLASGVAGSPADGMTWLIGRRRMAAPAPPRAVYDEAVQLASPDPCDALEALPGGSMVLSAWGRRRDALAAYRHMVEMAGMMPPLSVLPDLLHLHHVRMAGADKEAEGACLHLARAAALSWTARMGGMP